jgi:hypothetical protein
MTSRTDCTCTSDGNGHPPPRGRIPGAHRAPSSSSRRPPCFHLRGRGLKEARRKHVTKRPSGPAAALRSSSVAEVPLRYGALRAPIGCRSTSRNVREPPSRFGRFAAATRPACPTRAPLARRIVTTGRRARSAVMRPTRRPQRQGPEHCSAGQAYLRTPGKKDLRRRVHAMRHMLGRRLRHSWSTAADLPGRPHTAAESPAHHRRPSGSSAPTVEVTRGVALAVASCRPSGLNAGFDGLRRRLRPRLARASTR